MSAAIHRLGAAALVLTVALAGCGSDEPQPTAAATTQAAAAPAAGRYTVDEVAKLARMKRAPGGDGWVSLTGCRVTRVLTTRADVLRYRPSADAPVVTNPADDIGVQFTPAPNCREALTANLTLVR